MKEDSTPTPVGSKPDSAQTIKDHAPTFLPETVDIQGQHLSGKEIEELSKDENTGNRLGQFCGLVLVIGGVVLASLGLSGTIEWIIEAAGISSKLTNASPGIVCVVAGVIVLYLYRRTVRIRK